MCSALARSNSAVTLSGFSASAPAVTWHGLGCFAQQLQRDAEGDVGLDQVRVEFQGTAMMVCGFVIAVDLLQCEPQVLPGRSQIVAQAHSLLVGGNGLLDAPLLVQAVAQVEVHFGQVGLQSHGIGKGLGRFVQPALVLQGVAKVVVRRDQRGLESQGFAILDLGGHAIAGGAEGRAEGLVHRRDFGARSTAAR